MLKPYNTIKHIRRIIGTDTVYHLLLSVRRNKMSNCQRQHLTV